MKKNDLALNILTSDEERKKSLEYRDKGVWPLGRELQIKCKDGSLKWIRSSNSKLTDFMNSKYAIAISKDITDVKLKEKQLLVFHALLNSGDVGIRMKNEATNKVFFVNKVFEDIYGYPIKNFMSNSKFRIDKCIHP